MVRAIVEKRKHKPAVKAPTTPNPFSAADIFSILRMASSPLAELQLECSRHEEPGFTGMVVKRCAVDRSFGRGVSCAVVRTAAAERDRGCNRDQCEGTRLGNRGNVVCTDGEEAISRVQ